MTGFMTESKLLAIALEQLRSKKADPDHLSGLIAGYHDINNPCHFRNEYCAEGVVAGKELRQLLLRLDGKADDDRIEREVSRILFPDTPECVPDTVFVLAGWKHGSNGWRSPSVFKDPIWET